VIKGVKNPDFLGTTGPTDLLITVIHPNGKKINEGYFNPLTYKSKKTVGLLFFSMKLTSYYNTI
jgi:hypothetical protein